MLTKLTLTIESDVVSRAKEYARSKHRSVSKLVEEYLKTVSDTENLRNPEFELQATLTESITSMFKEEDTGKDYDELLESALSEDFE